MRLGRRVRTLERKAAIGQSCCVCDGKGWPAVEVFNAPPGYRPKDRPAGCRACGRVMCTTWISVGPNPTAEQARAFMEAL